MNKPYLGFGAGAHGCAGNRRYANIRSVEKYIARVRAGRVRRFPVSAAASQSSFRSRVEEMRETMWLGLRLVEAGVGRAQFRQRFGEEYDERFGKEIGESIREGLLERAEGGGRIRLSAPGVLLGNRVFSKFV